MIGTVAGIGNVSKRHGGGLKWRKGKGFEPSIQLHVRRTVSGIIEGLFRPSF
jgi:hypothetical protein